eukprot:scaffold32972_cov28-Tisochrysis_lutea.AAC.10
MQAKILGKVDSRVVEIVKHKLLFLLGHQRQYPRAALRRCVGQGKSQHIHSRHESLNCARLE